MTYTKGDNMILFYDFEVFKYDWLVVLIEPEIRKETVIARANGKIE